jgi:hypothetical protein
MNKTNKNINDMTNYEVSRWICLMMAVDTIDETCKVLNKKFEDVDLKPIAIKHYINTLSNKVEFDLSKLDKKSDLEQNIISKISDLYVNETYDA